MKRHLYGETDSLQNGDRLVKRRSALRERNRPRNSQLETHPDDERGRRPQGFAPPSADRFPVALKNSCSKPPCSGLLFLCSMQIPLELRRWAVVQRRVQTPFVVDALMNWPMRKRASDRSRYSARYTNARVQYVIATASGNNASGFGTQYCAWHSSTSSTYGNIAYTNVPYMTDAGGSCGANFNGLGANAGITIVSGHELAETISDQFPNGGWLDLGGAENGDKCAWITSGQGASANITLSTGTFPVQSLWSNAFNNQAGGCVVSYL
jgi:hypothetical protein